MQSVEFQRLMKFSQDLKEKRSQCDDLEMYLKSLLQDIDTTTVVDNEIARAAQKISELASQGELVLPGQQNSIALPAEEIKQVTQWADVSIQLLDSKEETKTKIWVLYNKILTYKKNHAVPGCPSDSPQGYADLLQEAQDIVYPSLQITSRLLLQREELGNPLSLDATSLLSSLDEPVFNAILYRLRCRFVPVPPQADSDNVEAHLSPMESHMAVLQPGDHHLPGLPHGGGPYQGQALHAPAPGGGSFQGLYAPGGGSFQGLHAPAPGGGSFQGLHAPAPGGGSFQGLHAPAPGGGSFQGLHAPAPGGGSFQGLHAPAPGGGSFQGLHAPAPGGGSFQGLHAPAPGGGSFQGLHAPAPGGGSFQGLHAPAPGGGSFQAGVNHPFVWGEDTFPWIPSIVEPLDVSYIWLLTLFSVLCALFSDPGALVEILPTLTLPDPFDLLYILVKSAVIRSMKAILISFLIAVAYYFIQRVYSFLSCLSCLSSPSKKV